MSFVISNLKNNHAFPKIFPGNEFPGYYVSSRWDSDLSRIACDGKTLRGSYDNFKDKKAIQILSAFLSESGIIPAHCGIEEKTDGIPVAQNLIKESGLENLIESAPLKMAKIEKSRMCRNS